MDLVEIGNPNTRSFYLSSGLSTGVKYRFRVSAQNAVGFGLPSAQLEMMPASVPGAPNTPTLTTLTSTSIQISWTFDPLLNGGSPVTDYTVYWDAGEPGEQYIAS